jgi:Tfp pilus assembly protein PilO
MGGAEAIAALAFFGGMAYVLRPVASALARRIAGEHRQPKADSEDQDTILAELQQLRQEMSEMQERLDFTERMLARHEDAKRLAPPG